MSYSFDNVAGLGFAVLSSLLLCMNGVVINKVKSLEALELSFWRCSVQTIILFPIILYRYDTIL